MTTERHSEVTDVEAPVPRQRARTLPIVLPGVVPVEMLRELGIVLPPGNYVTVAGAVLDRLGRIPEFPGDTVHIAGWEVEVVEVRGRAITEVLIRPAGGKPT